MLQDNPIPSPPSHIGFQAESSTSKELETLKSIYKLHTPIKVINYVVDSYQERKLSYISLSG